jgi:hypothetical protein
MNHSSRHSEIPANLSDALHHRLNTYALAASAAGVGMLALAPSATAKIVYTPAHVKISPPQIGHPTIVPLDLNHDGVSDFVFSNFYGGSAPRTYALLKVKPSKSSNEILAQGGSASALRAGVRVRFHGATYGAAMAECQRFESSSGIFGQWANGGKGVKYRYLGLRFIIKGQVHFGWARLNVFFSKGRLVGVFSATLTGYAYETISGKAIITGKTKGPDEIDSIAPVDPATLSAPTPEPASLGLLAMGSPGLSIWRREETSLGK